MLSNARQVLAALLLSLLIHALVFSAWPQMQAVSIKPLIVQGELIAPKIEEPPQQTKPSHPLQPPARIEPEPTPIPREKPVPQRLVDSSVRHSKKSMPIRRKTPVPHPQRKEPTPAPKEASDTGVALPLQAEKADTGSVGTNGYVVPAAPPLAPGGKLPMASKPAEIPLKQSTPAFKPSPEQDKTASVSSIGEDQVDQSVLAEYGRRLWEKASQFGGYPELALQRDWEGMVKVQVRYARSGVAYQISVKESSGYKVLDEQALEMVKQACARNALPDALTHKAFSVIVPIEFKLM